MLASEREGGTWLAVTSLLPLARICCCRRGLICANRSPRAGLPVMRISGWRSSSDIHSARLKGSTDLK